MAAVVDADTAEVAEDRAADTVEEVPDRTDQAAVPHMDRAAGLTDRAGLPHTAHLAVRIPPQLVHRTEQRVHTDHPLPQAMEPTDHRLLLAVA